MSPEMGFREEVDNGYRHPYDKRRNYINQQRYRVFPPENPEMENNNYYKEEEEKINNFPNYPFAHGGDNIHPYARNYEEFDLNSDQYIPYFEGNVEGLEHHYTIQDDDYEYRVYRNYSDNNLPQLNYQHFLRYPELANRTQYSDYYQNPNSSRDPRLFNNQNTNLPVLENPIANLNPNISNNRLNSVVNSSQIKPSFPIKTKGKVPGNFLSWKEFFVDCKIDVEMSEIYEEKMLKDDILLEDWPNLEMWLLDGFKDGHKMRVMKKIESFNSSKK